MSNLNEQFEVAKAQYLKYQSNENVRIPVTLQGKLYGLYKQIKYGDCKDEIPSRANPDARTKWELWNAVKGMEQSDAIDEFLHEMEQLVGMDDDFGSTENVMKQGYLFKRRKHFTALETRRRYFVLQGTYLHYFLDQDDANIYNAIPLLNCSVSKEKPQTLHGKVYYPFVITNSKTGNTEVLSSESEYVSASWMQKLREVCVRQVASAPVTSHALNEMRRQHLAANGCGNRGSAIDSSSGVRGIGSFGGVGGDGDQNRSATANEKTTLADLYDSVKSTVLNPVETLGPIPLKFRVIIEKSVQRLFDEINPYADDYEQYLMTDPRIFTKRKPLKGSVFSVYADMMMEFGALEVFTLLSDFTRTVEYETNLDEQRIVSKYSSNCWVEYRSYHASWPVAKRDFVKIVHWRQLLDGSIVLVSSTDTSITTVPVRENTVRGHVILSAFVIRPSMSGTRVQYIAQVDLGGTLHASPSVVEKVAAAHVMVLDTIHKILVRERVATMGSDHVYVGVEVPIFDELCEAATRSQSQQQHNEKADTSSSIDGAPSTSPSSAQLLAIEESERQIKAAMEEQDRRDKRGSMLPVSESVGGDLLGAAAYDNTPGNRATWSKKAHFVFDGTSTATSSAAAAAADTSTATLSGSEKLHTIVDGDKEEEEENEENGGGGDGDADGGAEVISLVCTQSDIEFAEEGDENGGEEGEGEREEGEESGKGGGGGGAGDKDKCIIS